MDPTDHDAPDGLPLPSLDALIAGTLASMTAWADPCPQSRLAAGDLRRVLARKVVSNLFFLQHHPHVSPQLREVIARAHRQWVELAHEHRRAGPVPTPEAGSSLH